ncbi:thiamine ABC transporter ATP-binding protein [Ostreibacterium oceani]|uniref:ATP-binding cassette domain-containing protein n=1 Tax=Ostreibacterium oceani TaxID=2654998 RepID=A0A6N7EU82_9GAMM|nr:ATP-binding cassette domain-containing protein [Ostreibacterium oceani]MPV86111.1 ATP-binding cassette domain-containing protein [Ostreibacterium oceani]
MLVVEKIAATYPEFTLAADFQAGAGEILVVSGPSGAGKTTLIELIAGFIPMQQGRILLDSKDISQCAPSARNMMTIFQSNNDFPHLSVEKNVLLGATPLLRHLPRFRSQVDAAMAAVGLSAFAKRLPDALSGGQRQRIALARSLLSQRRVWLLDEPFAALGPRMRVEQLQLIQQLTVSNQLITLVVTHQPQEMRLADRLLFLNEGKISTIGDLNALLDNPPAALAAYLAD